MSAAPYRRKGTNGKNGRRGCQVDLLIQTRRALCFVEVKRQGEIGREVIDQVDDQLTRRSSDTCQASSSANRGLYGLEINFVSSTFLEFI